MHGTLHQLNSQISLTQGTPTEKRMTGSYRVYSGVKGRARFIWFVLFAWVNKTNQTNKTNQSTN